MKRVLVIGSGGSGKTTFAHRLAESTRLPLIHLDSLYWRAGWVAPDPREWEETVRQLVRGESWIIDGNYGGTLDLRLAACDTVVFLDLSRFVCLWRVLRRWLWQSGRVRPELPPGCPERLTWDFLVWIWTYPSRRRAQILSRLARLSEHKRIVVLRSPAAIEGFLRSVEHPSLDVHRIHI